MNSFRDLVYELVSRIPKGKVATYGQIAAIAKRPNAARAVGAFMRTNPNAPTVPCHRVVAHDGSLTGYSMGKGIATKREMLLQEGVCFINHRVDLNKSLWTEYDIV